MATWTRPASATIPTVWSTFEGKKEIGGNKRKYWIQDITDEHLDEVLMYMTEEFVTEEPLIKYSKCFDHPELAEIWKGVLSDHLVKENLGLVCLTKDANGKATVAGMNCTVLGSPHERKRSEVDDLDLSVLHTVKYLKSQVDPFEKFNITEYLDAYGLYVPAKYRGEGLGLELLKARKALCRACGIKATITLFTAKISQNLAERAGFKDLYSIDYDELERRNPKSLYPGIQEHTKILRWMYILYE